VTDQTGHRDDQAGELPERDQLSLVNANISVPVNTAVAANVESDGSITGPHRVLRG
jgi:hypothetical protein